jgi:predicted methyltransferase
MSVGEGPRPQWGERIMTKLLFSAVATATAFALASLAVPAAAQDRAALATAAVAAPDRPDSDKERDQRRRPAASLEASPVEPGDRVLDLSSGPGYMARLYSSLVGPEGHVTAQNPPGMLERAPQIAGVFEEMAAARGNIDHMVAPANALTAEDASYDVVAITLSYHDRVNAGDVEAMNAEAYRVLKPGGSYFIVDHMAPEGSGASATSEFHRIEGAFVRAQVESAGFEFVSESDALKNPADPLTGGNRDDAGSSQFAYTFVKPAM